MGWRHGLSLREEATRRSDLANRVAFIWILLEAVIRTGIWWLGFAWLKNAEIIVGCICAAVFGFIWLDYRILQITLASMDEMQEYIDRKIQDRDEESDDTSL
jgi:hypothetical protein